MEEFEKELKSIMDLGYEEVKAGCYISNYYDTYICGEYNGGCKDIESCKMICDKLKGVK